MTELAYDTGKDLQNNSKMQDIKLLTVTWNMARKIQQPDFNMLIPNA